MPWRRERRATRGIGCRIRSGPSRADPSVLTHCRAQTSLPVRSGSGVDDHCRLGVTVAGAGPPGKSSIAIAGSVVRCLGDRYRKAAGSGLLAPCTAGGRRYLGYVLVIRRVVDVDLDWVWHGVDLAKCVAGTEASGCGGERIDLNATTLLSLTTDLWPSSLLKGGSISTR